MCSTHFCVLFHRKTKTIIATGYNQWGLPKKIVRFGDESSHAERNAITNAINKFRGNIEKLNELSLVVVRLHRTSTTDNTLICGNSLPCQNCVRSILRVGIRNVIATYDSDNCMVYKL